MPALWKVRRELARLRLQAQAVAEVFYEPWLRRRHDALRHQFRVTHGQRPQKSRVAIFVLFQPRGVPESAIRMCRHLDDMGFAPLVVSNSALMPQDLGRLVTAAWRIIERPNFGYDFGAYRDGLWFLERWQAPLDCLILANDSIWFPCASSSTVIGDLQAMAGDFCGILRLGTDEEALLRRGRDPFLGSFFLLFKEPVLRSDVFAAFWRSYRNTSNKYKTIRRGERGLSYSLVKAGFRMESHFKREQFTAMVEQASREQLRQWAAELVLMDSELEAQRLQMLEDAPVAGADPKIESQALRSLILRGTRKGNIFSSAPLCMLRDFKMPFIKKSRDPWNLKALRKILASQDASSGLEIELDPVVSREMAAVVGVATQFR